jgi:hypothetical protein
MEYYITDYQINGRQYRMGNQNGQYRETGNIGYTRPKQTKQKHNTICIGHNYYVNKHK